MNKYTLVPTLATAAALAFAAGSASAGGNPPVVNCLNNACFVVQPGAVDSDNDGFTDADEKAYGSDPFDPSSRPTMEWIFESIAYDTLPSFGPEPVIELITITPDGHAITADLAGLLGQLGHGVPDRLAGAGLTMPGIDLGTIGGTLNWDIHGNDTPANPAPPDMPDSGLYGKTSSNVLVGKEGNLFTAVVTVTHVSAETGTQVGIGWAKGITEEAAIAAATAKAEADAAARLAAQEAKKKDAGQHVDPDADQGVDPSTLTQAELANLMAANDGSDHTNKGDTGFEFTETEYVDPIIEIIHVNPDADQDAAGGQNGDGPNQGGEAGPDYDPRLPQGPYGAPMVPGSTM